MSSRAKNTMSIPPTASPNTNTLFRLSCFFDRTVRYDPVKLQQEEAELESAALWRKLEKEAKRRNVLGPVTTWGGSDVVDGSKATKKRKRGKPDEDYNPGENELDEQEPNAPSASKRAKRKSNAREVGLASRRKPSAKGKEKERVDEEVVEGPSWTLVDVEEPRWANGQMKLWLLGLIGGGSTWKKAVEKLFEYEASFGFQKPSAKRPAGVFCTTGRPNVVKWWIDRAHTNDPPIADVEKFGKSVQAWWRKINPTWRCGEPGEPLLKHASKDWAALRWPGLNGFLNVFACLFWWGSNVKENAKENADWVEMVRDVRWAIGEITRNQLDAQNHDGEMQVDGQ
uniref:Uncharacterized protein n=1 Tax=Mycena chlorophos TaxID=658473 RepID=A0ABQ0KXA4_MYCCL|nr:predicted protein [Mycena chlorophos]